MNAPDTNPELPGNAPTSRDLPRTLKDLIGRASLREYLRQIRHGLRQPKDSGEYKYAIHQLVRVWAPIAGIVLPIVLVLVVLLAPAARTPPPAPIAVTILENTGLETPLDREEEVPPLAPEDAIEPPPLQQLTPDQIASMSDEEIADSTVGPGTGPGMGGGDASEASAALNAGATMASLPVEAIRSMVKMPGLMVGRLPGAREDALRKNNPGGGPGGTGTGPAATEQAVYQALRWLKKYQEADGSWNMQSGGGPGGGGSVPAMTGFALLTYLAHGETPESEEFGTTVMRAIQWLLADQDPSGHFKGADDHDYCMPIATYALCEAYAMTRIPMVKEAADKAVAAIIQGQNQGGLWNYNFDPTLELGANSAAKERQDLSYGAWCIQALKAAEMAGLTVAGLPEALKRGVAGIKAQGNRWADGTLAFGYGRTDGGSYGPWEITGAGALCLQLLGQGKSKEAIDAQRWLKRASCDWQKPWMEDKDKAGQPSGNPIYHWYYVTQSKFHSGGTIWTDWNRQFAPQLVRNQVVVTNAIEDAKGNLVDIGYWTPVTPKEFCQSYVYTTALCALQLQVYYRYLPTYQTPIVVADGASTLESQEQDVQVDVR